MISSPLALATHERRFQAVVVGGLVTVFAIVALSPHTERALFEEGRIPAAFAAVVPAPVIPALNRFGMMNPATFARAFRSGRPTAPPGPVRTVLSNLVPGTTTPPVDDAFLTPVTDGPPVLVSDSGGLTPAGSAGSAGGPGPQLASLTPGFGLVGSGPGPTADTPTPDTPTPEPTPVPTTTPTPTPTGTPTTPTPTPTDTPVVPPVTTPTPTPPEPVSPVPEPASWIMLLTGMALVGVFTRRARKAKAVAASA